MENSVTVGTILKQNVPSIPEVKVTTISGGAFSINYIFQKQLSSKLTDRNKYDFK